jgi:lipopolysaccharide core galacturonosyltransferase RgtB
LKFIAFYFALQLLSRVLVSPNLELDEAEQVFLLQSIELGYGLQPPFYTWLQGFFFQVFGPSVFSLALLKNLLLFGVYASIYWTARQIFEQKQALAIALGLAFFPQILWEAQRDLSHSVLLLFCIAASMGLIIKGLRQGFTGPVIVGLALCAAVGIQSKYSFSVYAMAMFFALALQAENRSVFFSGPLPVARLGLFALVFFVVIFPHGQWLLDNWQAVQAPLLSKVRLQHEQGVHHGLYSLFVACLGFVAFGLISIVLARIFRRGRSFERPLWAESDLQRRIKTLLGTYLGVLFLMLLVLVVFFDVREMKDRWLQPFLVMLPLFVFLALPTLRSGLQRVWLWGGGFFMLTCLVLMPSRTFFAEKLGEPSRLNIPHMKLVAAIAKDFPGVEVITLNHQHEAGHFVLFGKQNARPWKIKLAPSQSQTFLRQYTFSIENAPTATVVEDGMNATSVRPMAYQWDVFQTEQGLEVRRAAGYSRH